MVPKSENLTCGLCDMMMAMVLFRRWKVLICGNPSADFLIISELSKSSSEDLVPLSELESTYNGSPRVENFAFSGNESHLGSQSR